ncbi:MAG TPA: response regulator [Thermoguttaceae bacterium]|nr:response regulator [Thermoguttaceae bacterium]
MGEKLVLLAEDDPGHQALFRRALAESGIACRVDIVQDGMEVIDYLFVTGRHSHRNPRNMPDLILLDLKMPKMDGLQVLQVMRRVRGDDRTRFPPVVVLTCSNLDDDVADAYRWGAQSYICKPVDYDEFADAVRETVQYWLGLNRPVPPHRIGAHYVHEGL